MAKLGNSANTDKIGRFLAENMGNQLYGADGGLAGGSPSTDAVQRPIRVASRSSRLSDKIKKEPPDPLLGSPVSPGRQQTPSPAGGAIIKQPVSPQQHPVYNPGRVFTGTVPVQGPSPGAPGPYYPQGVPRVPSLYQQQPLQQYPIVMAPHMSSQYPQAPAGGGPYQGSSVGPQGPAISQLLDLDSQKCIEHHSIELDENQVNLAELRSLLPSENEFNTSMVDAHLSENLSSNLNIIDTPPTNKLDLKTNGGTGGMTYIHNIPPATDSKVGSVPVSTDSLNKLTSELQFLNQM